MRTRTPNLTIFFLFFCFFFSAFSASAGNKQLLTVEGTIFDSAGTTPVTHTDVVFTAQIVAPNGCVLWQESFSGSPLDLSTSKGGFVLTVGGGTNTALGGLTWSQIFKNGVTFTGLSSCGGSYTGASSDDRTLYLTFSATNPTTISAQQTPAIPIKANGQNAMIAGIPFQGNPNSGEFMMFNGTDWISSPVSTGVTSLTGTVNQVSVSASTGAVTLSLPQNIHSGASPTFSGLTLSSLSTAGFVKNSAGGVLSGGNSISLSSDVGSSILPLANGGTGAITQSGAINNLLPAQGGNTGKVLQTDGTNVSWVTGGGSPTGAASGDLGGTYPNPSVTKIMGTTVSGVGLGSNNVLQNTGAAITANSMLVSNGTATGVTSLTTPASGVLTASASIPSWLSSVPVSMGGTGFTSYATGDLIYASTPSTLAKLPLGSNGQVLTMNGGLPSWQNAGGSSQWTTSASDIYFNTGKVGIGTTTPGSRLDVQDTITAGTFNGAGVFTATISADENVALAAKAKPGSNTQSKFGAVYGTIDYSNYTSYNFPPNSGSTAAIGEIKFSAVDSSNNANFQGVSGTVDLSGFGTTTGTANTAQGLSGRVQIGTPGTYSGGGFSGVMQNADGVQGEVRSGDFLSGKRGSITNATGLSGRVTTESTGSTITNAYGIKSSISSGTGTISNAYGVYIDNINATNKWAIYSNDSGASSYFAGNVGIGTTPARLLHINGAIRINPTSTPASPNAGDLFIDSADSNKLKWYDGSAWQQPGGGGGTPAGGNGQIQFNNSGSFGAASNFFWDNTNSRLGIGTTIPDTTLHVKEASGYVAKLESTNSTAILELKNNTGNTQLYPGSGNTFVVRTNSGKFWYFEDSDGTFDTPKLKVGSTIGGGSNVSNMQICTASLATTGTITSTGATLSVNTCSGLNTQSSVSCSPDAAVPTSVVWSARVTGTSQITINLISTNSLSMPAATWKCLVAN